MQKDIATRTVSNLNIINDLKNKHADSHVFAEGQLMKIYSLIKQSSAALELLSSIAEHFDISLDALMREDLRYYKKSDIAKLLNRYFHKTLQIPSDTIAIPLIGIAAASQYIENSEYDFPSFNLPRRIFEPYRLSTFKAFEIDGNSMPPVCPGSIIVGEMLEDPLSFEEGERYIVVHPDGVFFKRVFKSPSYIQDQLLVLKSDNTSSEYNDFIITSYEVKEMWKPFQIMTSMID